MAEPKIEDYCLYLADHYEVKSIIRHRFYRFVVVASDKRYVVPFMQFQPANNVDRVTISVNDLAKNIMEDEKARNIYDKYGI